MGEFKSKMGYREDQFFPGVIGTVDVSKRYVQRFKYFLQHLDAKDNDRYYIQEYSFWVFAQWKEFNTINGLPDHYHITDDIQGDFDNFLSGKYKSDIEQLVLF